MPAPRSRLEDEGSWYSCSSHATAGGWLRRASSGWCTGCRWGGARTGGGGQAPWPGGPLSQSRLQGRVQDVVVMAIAVGVTVIALGAGVVGRLLQPHEHVHLGKEQSA